MTNATFQTPTTESSPLSAASSFRHLFRPATAFKLLLAIENDDNAKPAIQVADALTARGALPSVITATELMVPVSGSPDSMLTFAEATLDEDFHFHRREALHNLIVKTVGHTNDWPIRSVVGDAALSIVDEASATGTELLVIGIHHHGHFEQAIGENTATRVMARASVPVFGVRSSLTRLPRKIMVATDFGNASREAAHLAANLADPDGVVVLVNVSLPSAIVEEGDEGAALVQSQGIEHTFKLFADEISKHKSIRVETLSRTGDAATELLAAAKLISPDLIAIASQRHRFVTRLLLGSVTRSLTRDGSWPMLVTPPLSRTPTAKT